MGVSASTSLNEAVSSQLPLMCTEKPRSCQVHWILGGEEGGREKANWMGFGSAFTKSHSCTDGNDQCL